MKLELAAVAVSLLLVGTGAAMAMPGNAPTDAQADDHSQAGDHAQADDHTDDERPEGDEHADANETDSESPDDKSEASDESDETDENETTSEDADRRGPPADSPAASASEGAGSQGPPADLPAQVPDFVGDVHDAINDFLGGDGEGSLGETVSSLTPDDGNETTAPADAGATGQ